MPAAPRLLPIAPAELLEPAPLPCYPCPHQSSCCSWGTQLTDDEARALSAAHGTDKVYRTRWGEWRTRVRGGRCVFMAGNACTIHADPAYPAVCRHFPHRDADGASPYPYDPVCPELV